MKQYYINGSEAYAPVPVDEPSHLPEDPQKLQAKEQRQTKGKRLSPLAVGTVAMVLILLFGVLFSTVRLFEVRSERAELLRQKQQLLSLRERLEMEYEQGIDLDAVAERAEDLGMGLPTAEQIQHIDLPQGEGKEEAPTEERMGVFRAILAMFRDMKEYFF